MKSDLTILSIWQSNFRTKKTEQLLAASLRLCLKNLGVKWVDSINYIKNYMTALIYNLPQIENFLYAFPHTHTDRHWRHRQHVACGSFGKKNANALFWNYHNWLGFVERRDSHLVILTNTWDNETMQTGSHSKLSHVHWLKYICKCLALVVDNRKAYRTLSATTRQLTLLWIFFYVHTCNICIGVCVWAFYMWLYIYTIARYRTGTICSTSRVE